MSEQSPFPAISEPIAYDESVRPSATMAAGTDMAARVDEEPVVRFVQTLLTEAHRRGASDIHIEPYDAFCRVRFRIDGVLHEVARPPLDIRERIAARIKVLSRLDIAERRVPQDGRMQARVSTAATGAANMARDIDIRVSTLPTLFGEKIVLRILDGDTAHLDIDQLGYEPEQKAQVLEAISRPHGMVLVTGPTGSGKTVTLYTCLRLRDRGDVNICTAEDPAEIQLPGINQVNIREKVGLGFATVLRAMLRQDPDIIMIGEIRDLDTADIAVKAAQTGHLVLATLHTNDAPATLARLSHMGVPPFHVAAGVHLITAQRLARRLCGCKRPARVGPAELQAAGWRDARPGDDWQSYRPAGCDRCGGTGFRGRCGIHQVMPVSEAIQRLILAHGDAAQIAAQARRDGVLSLREAGLRKVGQGLTSLDEVLAMTHA